MTPPTMHICCCEADCFFGTNANDGATFCEHNTTEVLQYKRGRPAFTSGYTRLEYSDPPGCSCEGSYVTGRSCPSSPSVDVQYDHFQHNDSGRVYTWYHQYWGDLWPDCNDPCCGYDPDDDHCCDPDDGSDCSGTYYYYDGSKCSKFQAAVISTGEAPAESSVSHADVCSFGNTYDFLKGVSNRDPDERYRHWTWSSSGGVVENPSKVQLAKSILCVVRREKWWERYYNSLSQSDNPSASDSDDAAAACATPRWWAFGCSAQWVSTWEIKVLSSLDNVGGIDVRDDFIEKVHTGEQIPEAWFDVLVQDGILGPIKDWGEAGGELVKKTLSYYDTRGNGPFTTDAYFFPAPGGWTYVCHDFSATPGTDLDDDWPQISRRHSISCDTGGLNNCHTAAPIPGNNCSDCAATTFGDPASIGCNPCTGSMGTCTGPPVVAVCGDTAPEICNGDVVVGTCQGVWIQYWEYLYAKASGGYSSNYKCGESNDGYLCRLEDIDDTCPWVDLPDDITHEIPQEVSASVRIGTSDDSYLCCGGKGMFQYGVPICPATTPRGEACVDPDVWGPDL